MKEQGSIAVGGSGEWKILPTLYYDCIWDKSGPSFSDWVFHMSKETRPY
jgi:hypothetical protein